MFIGDLLSLSFKITSFYFKNNNISGVKKQRVSRQLFELAAETKELELADYFIKIAHFFNRRERRKKIVGSLYIDPYCKINKLELRPYYFSFIV